ncbi:TIGR02302 family protein [Limibacillus sp. MBR-115]|uniref:TIGR02302 family protein n=1 Tax=Limibacillus sp. MBR-115 TaxID=3156465 RepID=UPI003394A08D
MIETTVLQEQSGGKGVLALVTERKRAEETLKDLEGVKPLVLVARSFLFWEKLWPALWPSLAVLLVFVSLALSDALTLLPGILHLFVLLAFAMALAASLWVGLRRVRLPNTTAGLRRLENDSNLRHRPLTALAEIQESGTADPQSRRLWEAHRHSVQQQFKNLRLKVPSPGLPVRDPIAVRVLLSLVLLVTLVRAGDDWQENLIRSVQPHLSGAVAANNIQLDLWVSPPAYTGQAPLVLATANSDNTADDEPDSAIDQPVQHYEVPQSSSLLVQIQGGEGPASATINGLSTATFKTLSGNSLRAEGTISGSGTLQVTRGGETLGSWNITVIADEVPTIEYLSPPQRSERASLQVKYNAADDYGVASVSLRVTLYDRPDLAPELVELLRPRPGITDIDQSSFQDFTPHSWAGLPVELTLLVEDALGQKGESDRILTVLPERIFQHPVARALVEQRKALTQDPEKRFPVARVLAQLYQRPEHFFDDIVVALAIHSAQRRLLFDKSDEAIPAVQDLLWKTALRIEEGELSLAERDLREIMEALQRALAEGAPDEVIKRLMDQLQAALDRYMDELARQAIKDLNEGNFPQANIDDNSQTMGREDLQQLLDAARQMTEAGANESARELLAQLQQMLENMRAATSGSQEARERREAMETMERMNGMLGRQRELLDRSFERSQRGEGDQGQPQGEGEDGRDQNRGENQRDAFSQQRLRDELGQMMEQLRGMFGGDVPQSLGEAQNEMQSAEEALRGDQPGHAVEPQRRALQGLQQGAQSLVDRFMQQLGQGQGGSAGTFGEGPGTRRDPLGRNPEGQGMGRVEGVEVPGVSERERALGIKRELQRRAGERDRPRFELDYLERLLRPF